MIEIEYKAGSILLSSFHHSIKTQITWDPRVEAYRTEAFYYRRITEALTNSQTSYQDKANLSKDILTKTTHALPHTLRDYQKKALNSWLKTKKGVVVLPTGAGKTVLAAHIIHSVKRSTLIVVPTIDLMSQWSMTLEDSFHQEIGMVGGGSHEIRDITVITYDSASLKMDFLGNQFDLLIFDECHHLPSEKNQLAARLSLARYRLGLTATPERDSGQSLYQKLIGAFVYREDIKDLKGSVLSPYEVKLIKINLTSEERLEYNAHRKIYIDFLRQQGIDFSSPYGWAHFLTACGRLPRGKDVFNSYLTQKRIAAHSKNKLQTMWEILQKHIGERTIIFTSENHTAYEIGKTFFLPVITHQTKIKERKDFLAQFKAGEYDILVTSKILNEGFDVPEASVGIIASGSGSVREHVQRLGRLLRKTDGKKAMLYELVSAGTSEQSISYRRSQHSAYQGSN